MCVCVCVCVYKTFHNSKNILITCSNYFYYCPYSTVKEMELQRCQAICQSNKANNLD